MRTYSYTIVRASGAVERTRCPSLFDPYEVARRLPHSLVFLRVPAGQSVSTVNAGIVAGPVVTLVHGDEHYLVAREPKTDGEAVQLWFQVVDEIKAKEEAKRLAS